MWVELTNEEIAAIIQAIGPGTIAQKLTTRSHPDTAAFAEAADLSSDYIHVPQETFIERTRNGAYVLAFVWVYNQDAGFFELTVDFDGFNLSRGLKDRLENLRNFRLTWFHPGEMNGVIGAVDGLYWSVERDKKGLTFNVGAEEKSPARFPLWKRQIEFRTARGRDGISDEDYFLFIADSVDSYRAYQESWRRQVPRPSIISGGNAALSAD